MFSILRHHVSALRAPIMHTLRFRSAPLLLMNTPGLTRTMKYRSYEESTPKEKKEFARVEKFLSSFTIDSIPKDELVVTHARSSGPGGQNVNKVNTKVSLRFNLTDADWLPTYTKKNIRKMEAGRVNKEDEFFVASEVSRTQSTNHEDCIKKIYNIIVECSKTPKPTSPEKIEKIIKIENAADARRRKQKDHQKAKRELRGRKNSTEF